MIQCRKTKKEAVKIKFKNFILKPWVLIIISAVLSALPLTFGSLFMLSWISFIPLFFVIITRSGDKLRYMFLRGFLFGFTYHVGVYYWFLWFYPLDHAGLSNAASVAVVLLAWFGISAVHGVLWCIPFLLCKFIKRFTKSPLFLSVAAIIGIMCAQKLTALGQLSFPWTKISLGQYKATALIQSASLFGADGVDMLILAFNVLLCICIISPPKKRIVFAISAAVLFLANLTFGLVRIAVAPSGKQTKIMTVQGSVSREDKWSDWGDVICYNDYYSLTKSNLTSDVELIIWPESAVPTLYYYGLATEDYQIISEETNTPILVGVLQRENGANTNDSLLVDKNGKLATYSKRQLVPFGEYMPYETILAKIFPFLTELNLVEDTYTPGRSSAIMEMSKGNVGNVICFESIYPNLTRQSTVDGAEIIMELTNDSWLEDSPAMKQHLAHGVFRSVENSRYLVRSANTGISATIDSRGRVIKQLDVDEKGVITDTVYFYDNTTLYTLTGDVLFPVCLGVFVILSLIIIIKRRKFTT